MKSAKRFARSIRTILTLRYSQLATTGLRTLSLLLRKRPRPGLFLGARERTRTLHVQYRLSLFWFDYSQNSGRTFSSPCSVCYRKPCASHVKTRVLRVFLCLYCTKLGLTSNLNSNAGRAERAMVRKISSAFAGDILRL
jgi:hypothetical protein